ncbi:hypothetical protein J0H58_21665 [bacterium]|nr:hypothetical protein [bacterium]
MPTQVVHHCGYCGQDRPHQVVVTRGSPTSRVLFCPFCDTSRPLGICCPSCGDPRFNVTVTRPLPDGSTRRVRKCVHCGHRIRTRERVESLSR